MLRDERFIQFSRFQVFGLFRSIRHSNIFGSSYYDAVLAFKRTNHPLVPRADARLACTAVGVHGRSVLVPHPPSPLEGIQR